MSKDTSVALLPTTRYRSASIEFTGINRARTCTDCRLDTIFFFGQHCVDRTTPASEVSFVVVVVFFP